MKRQYFNEIVTMLLLFFSPINGQPELSTYQVHLRLMGGKVVCVRDIEMAEEDVNGLKVGNTSPTLETRLNSAFNTPNPNKVPFYCFSSDGHTLEQVEIEDRKIIFPAVNRAPKFRIVNAKDSRAGVLSDSALALITKDEEIVIYLLDPLFDDDTVYIFAEPNQPLSFGYYNDSSEFKSSLKKIELTGASRIYLNSNPIDFGFRIMNYNELEDMHNGFHFIKSQAIKINRSMDELTLLFSSLQSEVNFELCSLIQDGDPYNYCLQLMIEGIDEVNPCAAILLELHFQDLNKGNWYDPSYANPKSFLGNVHSQFPSCPKVGLLLKSVKLLDKECKLLPGMNLGRNGLLSSICGDLNKYLCSIKERNKMWDLESNWAEVNLEDLFRDLNQNLYKLTPQMIRKALGL